MNKQFKDELHELKITPLGILCTTFWNFLKIGPNNASFSRDTEPLTTTSKLSDFVSDTTKYI